MDESGPVIRRGASSGRSAIRLRHRVAHPFRDGNGRAARVLAILMALQDNYPPLDYGGIVGRKKKEYIAAIHAAMGQDYDPMVRVFISVLRRTLKIYGAR